MALLSVVVLALFGLLQSFVKRTDEEVQDGLTHTMGEGCFAFFFSECASGRGPRSNTAGRDGRKAEDNVEPPIRDALTERRGRATATWDTHDDGSGTEGRKDKRRRLLVANITARAVP